MIKPILVRRDNDMGGPLKHRDLVIDNKVLASGFIAFPLAVAVLEAPFIDGLVTVKSAQRLDEGGLLLSALGSWAERGPAYHGRRTLRCPRSWQRGTRPRGTRRSFLLRPLMAKL